jgi:hypothetical protein
MTLAVNIVRRFVMSRISATARERILAQGFCGLNDATYAQINYPLRLAPAICMLWTAAGTALASPMILWALVPFAALGAILPGHPFDVFYNYGLRHLFGSPALPRYGARRRFACALATVMLVIAARLVSSTATLREQSMFTLETRQDYSREVARLSSITRPSRR